MPSTGTAAFTVSAGEMIDSSLRKLRVLKEGDVANQRQRRFARRTLNMLLKNMQSNGMQLWTYEEIQIPMVPGQNFYTIGPVGADVIHTRPLRLFDGTFIRNVCAGATFDTPLRVISRLEYLNYGSKNTQGVPNSIYYNPTIDIVSGPFKGLTSTATGAGELTVYVTPMDATRTIFGNFQRQIYDINVDADEFDLPAEWFRPLSFLLASDLSYEVDGVDPNVAATIRAKAKTQHDEIQNWTVETASVTFQPDPQMLYRR